MMIHESEPNPAILLELITLISRVTGRPVAEPSVRLDTEISSLGIDSLALLSFIASIEQYFGIIFLDEELEAKEFVRLNQIGHCISRKLAASKTTSLRSGLA